jgi:hypothetical protein
VEAGKILPQDLEFAFAPDGAVYAQAVSAAIDSDVVVILQADPAVAIIAQIFKASDAGCARDVCLYQPLARIARAPPAETKAAVGTDCISASLRNLNCHAAQQLLLLAHIHSKQHLSFCLIGRTALVSQAQV